MCQPFVTTEYTLHAPIQGEVRLALVSDLHEHDPAPVLQSLAVLKPDLITVAGDTFERHDQGTDPRWHGRKAPPPLIAPLKKSVNRLTYAVMGSGEKTCPAYSYAFLHKAGQIAPLFVSLGNHEWYLSAQDKKQLADAGATLLDNADCAVSIGENRLLLGGLSSAADPQWLKHFARKPGCKILLCHQPEFYDRYPMQDFALVLSGHVHGGQWRIKGRGVFAPDQGFLPRYHHGVYHNRLIVSAGCANTSLLPRWGNPCEVVLIRMVGKFSTYNSKNVENSARFKL